MQSTKEMEKLIDQIEVLDLPEETKIALMLQIGRADAEARVCCNRCKK